MNKGKWGVVVILGMALWAGCGSGENPNVLPRSDDRATSRSKGTVTFLGTTQTLPLSNSYAVALQDPTAYSDQWTLYVIFGMRSFQPLVVPQGVLAIFLDQVDPNTATSIEIPAGRVRAVFHTNFNQSLPVAQQTNAVRTIMSVAKSGYFILENESPSGGLQVRLHDLALSTPAGAGVLIQAQIPYRLTRIATSAFRLYLQQLGVDQPPTSAATGGGTPGGGGGTPGGGTPGGGSWPPPPPGS